MVGAVDEAWQDNRGTNVRGSPRGAEKAPR